LDLIIGQEWEQIVIINHQPEIITFKDTTVTKMAIRQAGAFNEKFTKPVTRIMAASKQASSIVRKGKTIKNVIKSGSTRTPEIMAYDPWLTATTHSSEANKHVVYIIDHTSLSSEKIGLEHESDNTITSIRSFMEQMLCKVIKTNHSCFNFKKSNYSSSPNHGTSHLRTVQDKNVFIHPNSNKVSNTKESGSGCQIASARNSNVDNSSIEWIPSCIEFLHNLLLPTATKYCLTPNWR
jgi:hypothetical protein